MICPDCNGRGEYLCCNGFLENCNHCLSTGRVAAIAIETQRAMTEGHGPKDESAGRNGIAQGESA